MRREYGNAMARSPVINDGHSFCATAPFSAYYALRRIAVLVSAGSISDNPAGPRVMSALDSLQASRPVCYVSTAEIPPFHSITSSATSRKLRQYHQTKGLRRAQCLPTHSICVATPHYSQHRRRQLRRALSREKSQPAKRGEVPQWPADPGRTCLGQVCRLDIANRAARRCRHR